MSTSKQGAAHLSPPQPAASAAMFEETPHARAPSLRGFSRSRQCQSVKLEVAHHIGLVTLPSRASASFCGLSDQLDPQCSIYVCPQSWLANHNKTYAARCELHAN